MPPTVQTLDQLMSASNSLYDPQRQQYQQQIGQATQDSQGQEQALMGVQKQAFGDIAQMASNKGMLFSGFAPDQQAKYNANTFMPHLADLRAKVSDNISKLQSALIGLDTDQRKTAMDQQGGQQKQLYDFNQNQDQRKWQEQQNQTAYQQEMAKLKQQEQFQASQNQTKPLSQPEMQKADAGALYNQLRSMAGKDGFISPDSYAQGLQLWQSAGYDHKTYDAIFSGLRNPNNSRYRLVTGWGS